MNAINLVYIAGAITGIKGWNKKAFKEAERRLLKEKYTPINPHELDHTMNPEGSWEKYLRVGIEALVQCDAILLLDGWDNSEGAQFELSIAKRLGMPHAFLKDCKRGIVFNHS